MVDHMAVISTWFLSGMHSHVTGKQPYFCFVLPVGTKPVRGEYVRSCVLLGTSAPELPGLLTLTGWPKGTPSQPAVDCSNLTISTCHYSQGEKTLRCRFLCLKRLRNIVENLAVLCSVLKTIRFTVLRQDPAWVWSSEQEWNLTGIIFRLGYWCAQKHLQ